MASVQTFKFLLLFFIAEVFCDDPRLNISVTDPPEHPTYKMIVQNKDKDVQLSCSVQNKPENSDVIWEVLGNKKNATGNRVTTDTRSHDPFRYSVDKPSTTNWRLRVQNVQVTSEGIYTCKVQVGDKSFFSDSKRLRVVQVPQISDLDTSSDMTEDFDVDARLDCFATGRPTPVIKWTRLAGELLPNGGTMFQGNTLRIDRVKSDDAGIYKCTAQNSAGFDEREITLSVLFRPEVTTGTPVVYQKIGYVKELVCDVKAFPTSTPKQITWMHEGMSVQSTGRIEIRNIPGALNRITSILSINGVEREDYGRYICSATNDKGNGQVTMSLLESDVPTADRSGMVQNIASLVSIHLATFFMLLSVCILQSLHWGR